MTSALGATGGMVWRLEAADGLKQLLMTNAIEMN